MKIIGITGPTGSGKSSLCTIFKSNNIPYIDADAVYHSLLVPPSACLDDIKKAFGCGVMDKDGALDRKALGAIVFNDKEKLNTLNNTVLGHVIGKIREMVSDYEKNGFDIVAVDAPTLIESGFNTECNCVISVLAPTEERLKRIEKRDSLTKEQALQRLNAQKSDDFYVDHSDFVIINDEGFEKTEKELLKILNGIRS